MDSDKARAGNSHNVRCVFAPSNNGPEEIYSGTLLMAGAHPDLVGRPVIIWAVRGPESERGTAGLLAQTFAGSATDAQGAKGPLVGDARNSVVLTLVTPSDVAQPGKPATASLELRLASTAV